MSDNGAPFERDARILGFAQMPSSGSWDVRIAFYRTPLEVDSRVTSITLHLSRALHPDESSWEARVYRMESSQALLVRKVPIAVDPKNTAVQTVALRAPMTVEAGHHVALVNTAGALKVFEKKLDVASNSGEKIWWSMDVPPNDIGSKMSLKSSANPFRLAWFAEVQSPTFVLGRLPLPDTGTWNIRLAFYKDKVQANGFVNKITLRLNSVIPAEQDVWEARIYSTVRYEGRLRAKCSFQIQTDNLGEQTIRLRPSLPVEKDQYVAIVNPNGALSIREKQVPDGDPRAQIYWTDKDTPSAIDSTVSLKRSEAAYHLGWAAEISTTDYHHGYPFDVASGSWDIRTAFYTLPAMANGYVNAVTLRLSSALPREQCGWEVRTYRMNSHNATMKRRSEVVVDGSTTDTQSARVEVPLYVEKDDFIALVNTRGPMKIRQKKLDSSDKADGIKIWWSAKVPPTDVRSTHMMKRSEARYALAWAAEVCRTPRTSTLPRREPWVVGLGAGASDTVELAPAAAAGDQSAGARAGAYAGVTVGRGPATTAGAGAGNGARLAPGLSPEPIVVGSADTPTAWLKALGLAEAAAGALGAALAVAGFDSELAIAQLTREDMEAVGFRPGDVRLALPAAEALAAELRSAQEATGRAVAKRAAASAHLAMARALNTLRPGVAGAEDAGGSGDAGADAAADDDDADGAEGDEGEVFKLKRTDGQELEVRLDASKPVQAAKRRIARATGASAADVVLVFSGRCMEDSRTLASHGASPSAPIFLVLRA